MKRGPGLLFLLSSLAALVTVAWLYAEQAPLRAGLELDAQHHIAAVRELSKGEFPPEHNLVAGYLPQGHYGPYLVGLGLAARISGAAPLRVLCVAGIASVLAFVAVASAAACRLVGEGAGRWAPLATLLLWGPWPRPTLSWPSRGWPGSTSIADVQNFFYPQQAGLILLLLVLVLVTRTAEGKLGAWRWLAAFATAALLIASHPLSGLALVPMLGALAVSELARRECGPRRIALLLLVPAVGLGIAAFWPYYPVLGLLQAARLPGLRVDPVPEPVAAIPSVIPATPQKGPALGPALPVVEILGPGLVGVLGLAALARSGRPFLACWFAADLLLSVLPQLPLRHRFVFFAALPLQLAACGVLEQGWQRGRLPRALVSLVLLAGAVSAGQRIHWLLGREVPDLSFVARFTPQDAVILSDQTTSNGIAGLAGRKVVAPQNPDLFLVAAGGWQRVLDVRRFLSKNATAAERADIVGRWQVTQVLVDRLRLDPPELPYPVVHEEGGYRLYAVPR